VELDPKDLREARALLVRLKNERAAVEVAENVIRVLQEGEQLVGKVEAKIAEVEARLVTRKEQIDQELQVMEDKLLVSKQACKEALQLSDKVKREAEIEVGKLKASLSSEKELVANQLAHLPQELVDAQKAHTELLASLKEEENQARTTLEGVKLQLQKIASVVGGGS